jgi:hypothetical protein
MMGSECDADPANRAAVLRMAFCTRSLDHVRFPYV